MADSPKSDLDELVLAAAQGDRRAVGAIAVALGPDLLRTARSVAGCKHDAEDVVQDFFVALLEGQCARFLPAQGQAIQWMCGVVKAMARKRVAGRGP